MSHKPFSFLIGLLFMLGISFSSAQDPVKFELLSDVAAIEPGGTFKVAVKADIETGWHIYWTNPGEAGLPTLVNWTAPEGFEVGETQYPAPHRYVQKFSEDFAMVSHTFEEEAFLIVEVTAPAGAAVGESIEIQAEVNWQACKETCTAPTKTPISLSLPIAASAGASTAAAAISDAWSKGQGAAVKLAATAMKEEGQLAIVAALPEGLAQKLGDPLHFIPESGKLVDAGADQIVAVEGNQVSLWVDLEDAEAKLPDTVSGFLVGEGSPAVWVSAMRVDLPAAGVTAEAGPDATTPAAAPASSAAYPPSDSEEAKEIRAAIEQLASGREETSNSVWLMLLGAFIGGIILNLMPCVFPVLGIKILGFVQQAGSDRGKIRRHGWVFALGVLLSLWALVGILFLIRAAGSSAGWGFQLQEPWFLLVMIAIMFVFALNLSGMFEIGTSLIGAGSGLQAQHGYGGSFFSGVLAVLVATPCTGPFMGPALGFALSGPPLIGFAIFTALAVGLALPYVVLSYFPALIEKLPRPGGWMETFKQFMAFPLFATVVWLLGVLGKAQGLGAVLWTLIGLVVVSMGLWIYGKYGTPIAKPRTRWFARIATAAAIAIFVNFGAKAISVENKVVQESSSKSVHGLDYEAFDPRKILAHQKAGRTVWIDFTAFW